MKKVFLLTLILMMFGSVVYAASYGQYKGYDIVKVQSNGETVPTEDVPAIALDGRTMVPISMLRELGANVSWDGESKTVGVDLPQTQIVKEVIKENNGNDSQRINDIKVHFTLATEYKEQENVIHQVTNYIHHLNDFLSDEDFDSQAQLESVLTYYNQSYNNLSKAENTFKELDFTGLYELSDQIKKAIDKLSEATKNTRMMHNTSDPVQSLNYLNNAHTAINEVKEILKKANEKSLTKYYDHYLEAIER